MTKLNPAWEFAVETEIFNHREVKPHFINPCCFGEDFAAWLMEKLRPLAASGFQFSELIQEDYGWGFWAKHGPDPFWIAVSCIGDGPHKSPAQWAIFIDYDPGLNLIKRLFHKPDTQALAQLRDNVQKALASNPEIKILPPTNDPGAHLSS